MSEANNINKLLNFISLKHEAGELNDQDLVSIIKLCGEDYLNLKTISKYATDNNMSYPGAKKFRNPVTIFGVKFIIDNE